MTRKATQWLEQGLLSSFVSIDDQNMPWRHKASDTAIHHLFVTVARLTDRTGRQGLSWTPGEDTRFIWWSFFWFQHFSSKFFIMSTQISSQISLGGHFVHVSRRGMLNCYWTSNLSIEKPAKCQAHDETMVMTNANDKTNWTSKKRRNNQQSDLEQIKCKERKIK